MGEPEYLGADPGQKGYGQRGHDAFHDHDRNMGQEKKLRGLRESLVREGEGRGRRASG